MELDPTIEAHRSSILRIASACGATAVRVFGSALTGPLREESDLDLLVSLEAGRSLLDRVRLEHRLEDLLGRPVDVVNERALHRAIRDTVLSQVVAL